MPCPSRSLPNSKSTRKGTLPATKLLGIVARTDVKGSYCVPDLVTGNAVIGQSGGPTAVINQSLAGVVEGLRAGFAASGQVKTHLRHAPWRARAGASLARGPGRPHRDRQGEARGDRPHALGRARLDPRQARRSLLRAILDGCRRNEIRYFFYIGGNDSADTCRIVSEKAAAAGYELRCFHVPKTIDNDLLENDHTPGFPSAARYVALALMGDALDNA